MTISVVMRLATSERGSAHVRHVLASSVLLSRCCLLLALWLLVHGLHPVRHNLGRVFLHALMVRVFLSLELALNVNEPALAKIRADELGSLAPSGDVMPFR